MTIQVFQGRLRQRFSTLAVITAVNPILLEGEVWIEKDAATGRSTGRRKVGDGQVVNNVITGTTFNNLPYEPTGAGDVTGPASSIDGRAALFDGNTGKLLKQSAAAPVLEGDARLSDARTPVTHASSHGTGGSDPITVAQSQVTNLSTALAGKEAAGTAAAAISAHEDAADPHPGYLTPAEGNAAYDATGSAAAVQAALTTRLDRFRDARTFWVSKRVGASDSNNGTSPGEPFLTIGAAVAAANAFRVANPSEFAAIEIGPGTYVEAALPMRLKPNILVRSLKQRSVRVQPAAGQNLNSFFAVDSGNMICDITFAGHQAENTSPTDSTVGTRAWAIQFNEQANGGLGPILTASPYIKDCLSLTAEDDAGEAGSTSTGDCGGGVEVDGAKVHPSSPIRSMVIYGFTQQNLGGPGAVIKNDGYAELVSFFGLFGTWHVRCESGGQATMSGGGCSEFGIYGLMADGYSPTALFTGSLRVAALAAALEVDVVSMTGNRLGTKSRPASGQLMLLGGNVYVVQSSSPINASGTLVTEGAVGQAGYRVTFFNPLGLGLAANVAQGATADFRLRSQISAGCHSANYVGSGTNYAALPWNGGVPVRANEAVESNFGRVFGLLVNDVGDVRIAGGAFEVDGTTGAVTINTDQFNLSGLNAIGPFSRNGGISTVGVQLQEVSNNATLLASTGIAESDTVPTQFAVKSYLQANYSKVFEYEQTSPATTWTINHNLGYKPAVEVFSVGSQELDADVVNTSVNQTVIGFTTATAGFARLN